MCIVYNFIKKCAISTMTFILTIFVQQSYSISHYMKKFIIFDRSEFYQVTYKRQEVDSVTSALTYIKIIDIHKTSQTLQTNTI